MFCSLPDLEMLRTDSSDSERFAYLDRIFSLFDQLLGEFNVYKYHHIKHSYVVVSSAAALEPRASSLRTELCNFLILAEFLNAIGACHWCLQAACSTSQICLGFRV
jgi:hypothetical protein